MTNNERLNKLSVITPVYKEEKSINELISHLGKQEYKGVLEIIVVDGDPEASTIKAIKQKDVKTITSEKGRAAQMNAGAAIARGEILLFLHADTALPHNALNLISNVFEDSKYVAGAFELAIDSGKTIFKLISKATSWRSHLTRTPYGDQAIFIKRDYFNQLGGYQNIPILEDVELMQRIKKQKKDIYIVKQPVITSARKWEKEGVAARTLKNQLIKIGYMLGVSPETLVKLYYQAKEKTK